MSNDNVIEKFAGYVALIQGGEAKLNGYFEEPVDLALPTDGNPYIIKTFSTETEKDIWLNDNLQNDWKHKDLPWKLKLPYYLTRTKMVLGGYYEKVAPFIENDRPMYDMINNFVCVYFAEIAPEDLIMIEADTRVILESKTA